MFEWLNIRLIQQALSQNGRCPKWGRKRNGECCRSRARSGRPTLRVNAVGPLLACTASQLRAPISDIKDNAQTA